MDATKRARLEAAGWRVVDDAASFVGAVVLPLRATADAQAVTLRCECGDPYCGGVGCDGVPTPPSAA